MEVEPGTARTDLATARTDLATARTVQKNNELVLPRVLMLKMLNGRGQSVVIYL